MRWVLGIAIAGCYAPAPPLGAPCGDLDICPTGLVCAPSTTTCELASGDLSDGPRPDVGADAVLDTPQTPLRSTFVGQATSPDGGLVSLKIPISIAAGSMLVLEVAARGNAPISISDSVGHTWIKDAEIENSTNTSVVGIFHVLTNKALSTQDEILAVANGNDARARSIALFQLDGATTVDQVGTAQDATSTPSVSTSGPLMASPELAFGVVVTGFNSPLTFTPNQGFLEVAEFATPLSSGSFNHKTIQGQVGTFEVTATDAANFAIAIATYR